MDVATQANTSTTQLDLSTEQLECKAAFQVHSQANAAAVAAEAASLMLEYLRQVHSQANAAAVAAEAASLMLEYLRTVALEQLQLSSKVLVTSFSNSNEKQ